MVQWLNLPGTTGHYARTPTTTALDVTNDLDIMVRVDANLTSGNTDRTFIGRRESSSTFALVYRLHLTTADTLTLEWTTAADVDLTGAATAGIPSGQQFIWIRATLDVDNGASGYDLKFWTSTDDTQDPDAVSWSQLGATVVGGATTSIIDARSCILEVGSYNLGAVAYASTIDIYRGVVRDGIAGTIIADFNGDDFTVGDSDTDTAVDSTGKTWTIFGAGSTIDGPVIADFRILENGTDSRVLENGTDVRITEGDDPVTNATATPATVNIVTAVPAATKTASAEKSVATVSRTVGIPTPVTVGGTTTLPATVNAIAAVPAAIKTASVEKTAGTVNAISAIPAATKTASVEKPVATVNALAAVPLPVTVGGTTALPATVNLIAAIPAVIKSASVEKTATTVNLITAIPQAARVASVEKNASTVNLVGAIPTAVVTASAQKTAITVNTVAAIPASTRTASVEKTTSTVNAVAAIPVSTRTASVEKVQPTVNVVAFVPQVAASGGGSITVVPVPVGADAAVPLVVLTADTTKLVSTVNLIVAVPSPTRTASVELVAVTVTVIAGIPLVTVHGAELIVYDLAGGGGVIVGVEPGAAVIGVEVGGQAIGIEGG